MIRGSGSAQRPVLVELSTPPASWLSSPRTRGATGRPQAPRGSIPAAFRLSGQFIIVSLARRAQDRLRGSDLPLSLVVGALLERRREETEGSVSAMELCPI